MVAPGEAVGLLHLLAHAVARRQHQRVGADDGIGLGALGERGRVAVERLLQPRLDLGIGRAAGHGDEIEHHLLLRRLVGDQALGAGAGAHLGQVAPAVEAHRVEPLAALEQDDGPVDGGGEHELLGDREILDLLAEDDAARHLDAVQRRPAGALGEPKMVGRPLLQGLVVAAASQLPIDDGREPPFAELALELDERALVGARRRLVDDAHELHGKRRAADAEAQVPRGNGAPQRRERDLEHAREIDAEGIEQAAEVLVLQEHEALPVMLRHLAHGDRLVVGVGDVVADIDGRARVVDVAQAIEARVEGADEVAVGVVDGGRQPALGVIAQLLAKRDLADEAANGRDDVDERHGEEDVEEHSAGDVAQRPETGIERHPVEQHAQETERQEHQQLERARQHTENGKHIGRRAWGMTAHARPQT